jgi:hypothetical protein
MSSFNQRGCDEIMWQFVNDRDTVMLNSIDSIGTLLEEDLENINHSSLNINKIDQ